MINKIINKIINKLTKVEIFYTTANSEIVDISIFVNGETIINTKKGHIVISKGKGLLYVNGKQIN